MTLLCQSKNLLKRYNRAQTLLKKILFRVIRTEHIEVENIRLGMLNRSKLQLNRFGTILQVKNYREILKAWHYKEKPANESVPILKPVDPSSPFKTVKNSKISDNQLHTIE